MEITDITPPLSLPKKAKLGRITLVGEVKEVAGTGGRAYVGQSYSPATQSELEYRPPSWLISIYLSRYYL